MSKPFSWSYSRLTAHELCPRKAHYDQVNKTFDDGPGTAAHDGKIIHKAFQDYVETGKKLPFTLTMHRPLLDKLRGLGGEILTEQQLALDANDQPVEWFSREARVRSIIDIAILDHDKGSALVLDYKTGKRRLDWDQVISQSAVLQRYAEQEYEFKVGYYWTKSKQPDIKPVSNQTIQDVWEGLCIRAQVMEDNEAAGRFPARQCFLCKQYCADTSCKFNGGRP